MNFKFLEHSHIIENELLEIVALKKTHWHYSIEEHISWMQNNIKQDDTHVLMYNKEEVLVGYLNLIKTDVVINNMNYPFLGIGNVCSKEKGRGYGNELLIEVNKFLINNNERGILLCSDNLINFYKKFKWKLVDEFLKDQSIFNNVNIMLFNFDVSIRGFLYNGRNF